MADEKTPPAESQDTGAKSVEQVMAELKATNERLNTLEKQNKDKEEMIGRQSNEIGELRKKMVDPTSKEPQVDDEEVAEVMEEVKKLGLDNETARFNAELLVKAGRRRDARRMMADTIDIIQEWQEDGKLPEFESVQTEVMNEFQTRKLAPTARKNAKLLKDCYEVVIKRKADAMKEKNKDESEAQRSAKIEAGSQPPPGGAKAPTPDEDRAMLDSIKNAGTSKESVFF